MTALLSVLAVSKSCVKLSRQFTKLNKGTMGDWKAEKDKFLSLTYENKRAQYKCKRHYTLDEIPTWRQYYKEHKPLPEKIPLLTRNKIDSSKNESLPDKISIFRGDITTLEVDAIVNAANKKLLGGGGVDGAIHSAAGPHLLEECRTLNGCVTGESKITGGYKLPAKYVIHTVGPVGEKPDLLMGCYESCLNIMKSKNLKSLAFPCVSTGIYGYPLEPAAHIAAMQVRTYLESNVDSVERIVFCLFSEADEAVYQKILQSYFPIN